MSNASPMTQADMDNTTDCTSINRFLQEINFTIAHCKDAGVKVELQAQQGILTQRKIDPWC